MSELEHLTDVGEIYAGEMYQVDNFLVEFDADKRIFYWVEGSGCSCWDGYGIYSVDSYDGSGDAQAAHNALDEWAGSEWRENKAIEADVADLHLKIASL